jgi:hypothetical protein
MPRKFKEVYMDKYDVAKEGDILYYAVLMDSGNRTIRKYYYGSSKTGTIPKACKFLKYGVNRNPSVKDFELFNTILEEMKNG